MTAPPPDDEVRPPLSPILERNIRALHERRRAQDQAADAHQRFARRLACLIGTMGFAYAHLAAIALWIVIQLGLTPIRPFDPHFMAMVGFVSVESIFLTILVLINQRLEARAADQRAELDLQIGLLSEHEVTRLIGLVAAMAAKLGVAEGRDPEIAHLAEDIAPEEVLDELDARDLDEG
ncbi:MAG: hypothetical protein JWO33_1240 [Caulobacteraceae bacterium]|nr:hypothetical protein [Caulobacteraceae bacterium]